LRATSAAPSRLRSRTLVNNSGSAVNDGTPNASGKAPLRSTVQALLQPIERAPRRQHLANAPVRLALLLDRGDELAVLQLDAVHRHGDAGQIDLLVIAVEEVVIARDVRAVVADIAEERALRPFVVERQRERADRAGRRRHADAHVHRDAELRMLW